MLGLEPMYHRTLVHYAIQWIVSTRSICNIHFGALNADHLFEIAYYELVTDLPMEIELNNGPMPFLNRLSRASCGATIISSLLLVFVPQKSDSQEQRE